MGNYVRNSKCLAHLYAGISDIFIMAQILSLIQPPDKNGYIKLLSDKLSY